MDDRTLFTILQTVVKSQGQLGRSGMLKLLQGRDSRKLAKLKLDHISEYGSLKAMSKNDILDQVDHLIESGCLSVSVLFFPLLDITEVGKNILATMARELPIDEPIQEPDSIHVCDEMEFWRLFPWDLAGAHGEVIIYSPFVSGRRVNMLLSQFNELINQEVKIELYIRPTERRAEKDTIESLKAIGIKINYRDKMHHKAAIIDRAIAWEGSLNILQHWDSSEQMTRHTEKEYIKNLLGVLGLV